MAGFYSRRLTWTFLIPLNTADQLLLRVTQKPSASHVVPVDEAAVAREFSGKAAPMLTLSSVILLEDTCTLSNYESVARYTRLDGTRPKP